MNKDIILLGERIVQDKYLVAELVREESEKGAGDKVVDVSEEVRRNAHEVRADFIGLLGESIIGYLDEEEVRIKLSKWGAETGNYFLSHDVSLDFALLETNLYRKHIAKLVKSEAVRRNISIETLFEAMELFHSYMDYATYTYSSAYLETYKRRLAASRKQFLELSAPVVPVTDKIAILPLIGDIDLERGRFILEKSLIEAVRLRADTLILDLSGVVQVDGHVADQVTKITRSLEMIGVRPILTGVRPEIARTLTMLGTDTTGLVIGGTLKQAFQKLSGRQMD